MLFKYWFTHVCTVVSWRGCLSLSFQILSGVRQDGMCSCWLFYGYIHDLVAALENSKLVNFCLVIYL